MNPCSRLSRRTTLLSVLFAAAIAVPPHSAASGGSVEPSFGIENLMTVQQAIAAVRQQKEGAYREQARMVANDSVSDARLHKLMEQGDVRHGIHSFLKSVNEGVIKKLEGLDPKTMISGREVSSYGKALHLDLGILHEAIRKEAQKEGARGPNQLSPVDFKEILTETGTQRKAALAPLIDKSHPGPVAFLDEVVVQKMGNRFHGGDAPSGGGADPSGDAWRHIAFGDVDGARKALQDAAKNGTADANAYTLSGSIALAGGQYSSAVQDAQRALQLEPDNRRALALLHFSEGRTDAAGTSAAPSRGVTAAANAAGTLPAQEDPGALTNATRSQLAAEQVGRDALAALGMGDMQGALGQVGRALALDPNNPRLLNLRASIYARLHEFGKALADANAGLALAPHDPVLLATKAYAQLRSGDAKGALASAEALLEADPRSAFAYGARAQAYGLLGDRDAMMADLSRAAELDASYGPIKAQAAQLQLPSDKDVLFLFPGEAGPQTAQAAPVPAKRGGRFGLILGASVLGGLLLALGLMGTVLAPVTQKVSSAFTRLTRRGPSLGATEGEAGPAATLVRGQYEITREIGVGGMGRVYEGTDRSLGRRVAIKKMRDELRADPRERARFVSEAKTVAALHHPNIVDIYAIAEEGEDVYLVFEFVDGKTVHDLVQESGRLEPEQAVKIARAAADALDFAHSRGIIHRDMKPSNVMLDSSGRVKVMDFGIARAAKDALTRYSMTNTVVGTPPYMAPEQEQGQVRRESDAYGLAVCAYEMLTGKLPFAGVGGGMLLNKINMSFAPPARMVPGLPPALDEVFTRAFQADPEKRYRTPGEFAAALESVIPAPARA